VVMKKHEFKLGENGMLVSKGEYGTLMTNVESPTCNLDLLDHVIKQLKFYLKNNRSPNPKHTKIDLQAYKDVRDTRNNETMEIFFNLKDDARLRGNPFPNNRHVIDHMKKNNMWRT